MIDRSSTAVFLPDAGPASAAGRAVGGGGSAFPAGSWEVGAVPNALGWTVPQWESALGRAGLSRTHARAVWRALFAELVADWTEATALAPSVARFLASSDVPAPQVPAIQARHASSDGLTQKFLFRLADGAVVEAVLMGYAGRRTACLSTQVGCAMGCVFCATGQGGFRRHLQPGEIVGQVVALRRWLRANGEASGTPLRNLVLMGMGEPLHNYDAVMQALDIVSDTTGLNIGPSRITISTVGLVPAIRRMADERRKYLLAVSLHGSTDAERSALVPVGKKWDMAALRAACEHYSATSGEKVFFEWTLIHGRNDTPEHAARLVRWMSGLRAHLNLIPLNPTAGFAGEPAACAAADRFRGIVREAGFPCTIRQFRGIDVDAGCGQLAGRTVAAP